MSTDAGTQTLGAKDDDGSASSGRNLKVSEGNATGNGTTTSTDEEDE